MSNFEWAVELGRYLEKVRSVERRVDRLESDVGEIKTLIRRVVLLALLWGGAITLSLSNEKAAEAVIPLIRKFL